MTAPTHAASRDLTAAGLRYTQRIAAQAAGAQVSGHNPLSGGSWQARAWHHYALVPELRFAARWIGAAMSQVRLYAGRRVDDLSLDPAPPDHPAARAVAAIAGGVTGQSALLKAAGPHLVVAGESWTVVRRTDRGTWNWRALSTSEITPQRGKLVAVIDGQEVVIPAGDDDRLGETADSFAIRVWEPHPERYLEADSPVRSTLDVLDELEMLGRVVKAVAQSRLTGRGVLLFPQGVRFPTAPGQSDGEDDLIAEFAEVAGIALREPTSAAATVPIILEVPGEMVDRIKHLTFDSEFDALALELRREAIHRLALGLEIPPEYTLGRLGEVNHWGQWALSQEAVQLGVVPVVDTWRHAHTEQYLRPLLRAQGLNDADEWVIGADTSPLRVRQNRAQTALEVHARGALSDEALRRETGFEESDAPTPPPASQDQNNDQTGDTEEPAAPPQGGRRLLPADETTTEPDTLPASAAPSHEALYAAADGLVYAALTAAGVRLRHSPYCPRPERARARDLDPTTLHTIYRPDFAGIDTWRLLSGAWSRAPEVAGRYGVEAECLTASLDDYARELIVAGQPHTYDRIPQVVSGCLGVR